MHFGNGCYRGAVAVAVGLSLVACGGGGGGADGGGGSSLPNIALRSNGGLYATNVTVGSTLPAQSVGGTASGDANSLNGRTVYVVVEDPAELFAPAGHTVRVDGATGNFTVTLQGRVINFTGRRAGTFQVRACLDAQCTTQLTGSPLVYPYEVVSAEPLTVSSNVIRLTRRFGQTGSVNASVLTRFPPNATFQIVRAAEYPFALDETFGFRHMLIGFDGQLDAATGSHHGTVETRNAAPGTYIADIRFRATVPGYSGFPFQQDQSVRVEYEVVDDPAVAAAFHPASVVVNAAGSGCQVDPPVQFLPLLRAGDRMDLDRIDYLSEPASAAGHPFSRNWLVPQAETLQPRLRSCTVDPSGNPIVLPAGTYEAHLVYLVTRASGARAEAVLPIRYVR